MKRKATIYSIILIISMVGLPVSDADVAQAATADSMGATTTALTQTDAEAATRTKCDLPHARIGRSSPAVGDLDDDGVKEIVVGGSDGYVYAINPDCSPVAGWPKQVNDYFVPSPTQDVESSPVLADIDGDNRLEVIVTVGWMPQMHQNGGAIVFEHDGTVKSGWPQATLDVHGGGAYPYWEPDGYSDGVFSTPAIGDIDGDEEPDIVYGGFDKCIYAWHADGTPVDGWWNTTYDVPARCMPDTIWSSPALVDLDGDWVLDIVIGTDVHPLYAGGSVWAFKGDNTELWHTDTTQTMMSSPAVGDINDDGYPEIVIGTGNYYPQGYLGVDGHKVYAFDRFGNNLPGWPRPTAGDMYASPSLADLDGDGTLEIMIGCGTEVHYDPSFPGFCNYLYAWNHDGTTVPNYPTTIRRANPWPAGESPTGMPYGPVLVDYDDNGEIDVFLVEAGSWGISIFQHDTPGTVDISHYSDNTLQSSPVVDNLYGNNIMYLVAAGANSSNKAAIYIWDLSSSAGGARPWPMFRQNSERTGRYRMPARLASRPESLYVMHQYGEPGPEQKTIWLANGGDEDYDWVAAEGIGRVTLTPTSSTYETQKQISVEISTSGLGPGTYDLGDITITATTDGKPIVGSPVVIPVTLYVGDVYEVYLPLAVSRLSP
jgi:hypothetical protein